MSSPRANEWKRKPAMDLFFVVTLSGADGARLLHVLFEEPQYYIDNPWRVFAVLQGGFVYYGGLIFGFFAAWLYLLWKKQSFAHWLDFFTPVVSLSYATGRIACFLTGCCYGKLCDLPWAIAGRHPTQLYAVILELLLFCGLLKLERNPWCKEVPGRLFALWLAQHSANRMVVELFRADPRGPTLGALSISTLLSLVFFVLCLGYLKLSHSETKT